MNFRLRVEMAGEQKEIRDEKENIEQRGTNFFCG
jgi:hypothetical protein